jgi:20S proteasome alpha/beta subunit
LTTDTIFYIQHANTTKIALAATSTGPRITLTKSAGTDPQLGHYLQGITATGTTVVGGAQNNGVAHAGWNVRTVGSGGRAGRVQYETLVAMGSITGDGSDDTILPDS